MSFKTFYFSLLENARPHLRSRYLNNIIWMFADKGVRLISELIVGIFIARYLGAGAFGLLSFAISYVTIVYGISSLGLSELVTRELVHFKFQHDKILGSAFFLRIIASLFFIAGINICAYLMGLEYEARIIIFIISSSVLWKAMEIIQFYFQAEVASQKIAKIHLFSCLVVSVIKIIFVIQERSIYYFAIAYSVEWFINAVGFCYYYSVTRRILRWRFSKHMAVLLLRNSWYLIVSGLAVDLYMRVDQIMIRQMIGDAANGCYAVATRISEMWYAIPAILCSVLFPALLNAKKVNQQLFNHRILYLFSLMFWISLAIGLIITPFAKFIIVYLYSEEYVQAGQVLSIHIWTGVFVFWGVTTTYWGLSENLQYISLIRTVCGLIINVGLNVFLIPAYGINGAAIATLFSQAVASSFSLLLFSKSRNLFFMQIQSIIYPILSRDKFR